MCGSHQREDVQRWIGVLQEKYPTLAKANIIYDITDITELNIEESDSSSSERIEQAQPKLAAPAS